MLPMGMARAATAMAVTKLRQCICDLPYDSVRARLRSNLFVVSITLHHARMMRKVLRCRHGPGLWWHKKPAPPARSLRRSQAGSPGVGIVAIAGAGRAIIAVMGATEPVIAVAAPRGAIVAITSPAAPGVAT